MTAKLDELIDTYGDVLLIALISNVFRIKVFQKALMVIRLYSKRF